MKTNRFILFMASIMLATAFIFSCSSDDPETGESSDDISSSSSAVVISSSSSGGGTSSSSSSGETSSSSSSDETLPSSSSDETLSSSSDGDPSIQVIAIDNLNPKVGDTLSVSIDSSFCAEGTKSYTWQYNNAAGDSIGTDSTYTVVEGDVGESIIVTAACSDAESEPPTVTSLPTEPVASDGSPSIQLVSIDNLSPEVGDTLTVDVDSSFCEGGTVSYVWGYFEETTPGNLGSDETYEVVVGDLGKKIVVTAVCSVASVEDLTSQPTAAVTASIASE